MDIRTEDVDRTGWPPDVPKWCSQSDPRCRALCTLNMETREILDPECFR